MKKVIIGLVVALACLGGGYVFIAQSAQTAAEEAVAGIERDIEASIPNSDFTFGTVSADVFAGAAHVSDLALKVDGKTLATATSLVISGDDKTVKRAEIIGLEGALEKNREQVKLSAQSILLAQADIASLTAIIDAMKSNPAAAITALDGLSVGELAISDISFTGIDRKGREAIRINGQIRLAGVANGAIGDLVISGSLKDNTGVMDGDAFTGDLGNFSMSGLKFADIANAVARQDEQMLLAQLQQAFGVSNVSIESLEVTKPEDGVKAGLASGSIEIADNVIKTFSLRGLDFSHADENITAQIGEAQFKGLDLSVDFTSETALLENAAQLYGLTDIGIKNASFRKDKDEIAIAELSLAEVDFEDGLIVKGKTSVNGLRIPLALIKDMDRSAARTISNFTDSEDFVLSLSSSVDFDTAKGTYDSELDFGAEGFAKIRLVTGLAGLDAAQIRKASKVTDIFEAMQIWGAIAEEVSVTSVTLEYTDEQLADTVLAEVPDINQLAMMSEMQIDMVLGQYPEQANQLKAAVKAFLEGKNGFKASAKAQSPVKIAEMEKLFMSGGLANAMSFEFSGS